MPDDRLEWLHRIKAVEREYSAARLAIDRLLSSVCSDPTILLDNVTIRDVVHASERLDGTYVVRIFTAFEAGLRLYWAAARQAEPPARTRDLVDSVAAMRQIPNDRLVETHTLRDYRNSLVHERENKRTPIGIAEARRCLCTYFSFLPLKW